MQHRGRPYRILFAFTPDRTAILLTGGDKTGSNRWYERAIPKAEAAYATFLDERESDHG